MKSNEQHGKFTGPGEVRLVRTLPGPIERIWEYLTDPEKRARWFAGGPMEPKKGGKMELFFLHKNLAPDETPPEDIPEYKQYVDPRYSQQLMAESIPDADLPSVSLPRKGPAVEAAPEAGVEPAVEAEQ